MCGCSGIFFLKTKRPSDPLIFFILLFAVSVILRRLNEGSFKKIGVEQATTEAIFICLSAAVSSASRPPPEKPTKWTFLL